MSDVPDQPDLPPPSEVEHSDEHIIVRYRPREGDPPFLPLHGRIFMPGQDVAVPVATQVRRKEGVQDLRAEFEARPDFEVVG